MSTPISLVAVQLVADYAHEVSDAREWPNAENEKRTRQALFEYISALEQRLQVLSPATLEAIKRQAKPADKAFAGGGL